MEENTKEINYFQAVVDTGKLISIWLVKKKELSIESLLVLIENTLENKYGPFSTPLSSQISDFDESLGLKQPTIYWKGVKDTIKLIKHFITWKKTKNSERPLDNFLEEMIHKAQLRLIPEEDLLLLKLGLSFSNEFKSELILDNRFENQGSLLPVEEELEPQTASITNQPTIPLSIHETQPNEYKSENNTFSDNFDSLEATTPSDSEPEEFIEDSISEPILNNFKIEDHGTKRDYLRSALDELNKFSDGSTEVEEDIEDSMIKIKDSMFWTPSTPTDNEVIQDIPTIEKAETINESADMIIQELKHDEGKEESKLLSSSLREALKMLREED